MYCKDKICKDSDQNIKKVGLVQNTKELAAKWKIESNEVKARYKEQSRILQNEINLKKSENILLKDTAELETHTNKKRAPHQPFIKYCQENRKIVKEYLLEESKIYYSKSSRPHEDNKGG